MSKKSKVRLTQHEETGSVRFDRVKGVEFWMTAVNRIFIITKDGRTIFPSLQGSILRFDSEYDPAPKVKAKLIEKLHKQRELRMEHWVSPEEDEIAFTYS